MPNSWNATTTLYDLNKNSTNTEKYAPLCVSGFQSVCEVAGFGELRDKETIAQGLNLKAGTKSAFFFYLFFVGGAF